MPIIQVPLRTGERPATLDLQDILNRIYDAAGSELYIYQSEPDPPLSSKDGAWASTLLPKPR